MRHVTPRFLVEKRAMLEVMRRSVLTLVATALVSTATTAAAELVLVVTPGPVAGQTTWTFSGDGLSQAANLLQTGTGEANSWQNAPGNFQYTTINNTNFGILSGSATISDADQTVNIDLIYIDDDGALQDDDIGFSVDTEMSFGAGETISWTGSVVVGIDIVDVTESGPFNVIYTGANLASLPSLNWTVVPEPSTLTLAGLGLIGLLTCGWRRRRRA